MEVAIINLKKLFKKLQTDAKSMLFTEETVNQKMLKNLKKSACVRDKEFVNLFVNSVDYFEDDEEKSLPIKTVFVKKRKMTQEGLPFTVSMARFNCCAQTLAISNFWESVLPTQSIASCLLILLRQSYMFIG